MPRIRPKDILRAKSAANKSLLSLLPICRDLSSARKEVKWMTEHALTISQRLQGGTVHYSRFLSDYVHRRARGEPLQYILGSEWFGELEIKCRPGVLIPRQETAASVTHLARLLRDSNQSLRVLDLCTGSGCIPLLFHDEFYSDRKFENSSQPSLDLLGVDISSTALSLARENLIHQIASQARNQHYSQQRTHSLHRVGFVQADVFQAKESLIPALARVSSRDDGEESPFLDVLISNPPYISPSAHLPRSVRFYEPELALIPKAGSSKGTTEGDEFYPALLHAAEAINAKVLLLEVGDVEQAKRVAGMIIKKATWDRVEIWRDYPSGDAEELLDIAGRKLRVRGEGNGRSVFAIRGDAVGWINSSPKS